MNHSRLVIFLLIGLGAAIGANARYWLGQWVVLRLGAGFPYGTLLINVLGSLAIGLFLGLVGTPNEPDTAWRLFVATGLLGGFTTFSTFSYETLALINQNRWPEAGVYIAISVILGLLATALGVWLVRMLHASL
jgi:fluoride exporter